MNPWKWILEMTWNVQLFLHVFQRDSLKILRGFYVKIVWRIHSKKSISKNFTSGEWGGLSRDRVDQVSIEIAINFLKWLFTSIQKHVCFSLDINFFQLPSYDQSLRNHWVKSSKITYMDSVKRFFEGDTLRVFPITVLEENAWKTRLWKRCWRFDRMIINFPKRSIPLKFVSMMHFWALFTKHFVFCGFFDSVMRICSFFTPIHFRDVFSMVLRDVS